ncbi:MAG TPA: hypothetical protein VK669_11090 [Candidatus Limnocylindrales bacterium]|nr:hypothetical protein [Candidatus Limnocylindrales bacterium]
MEGGDAPRNADCYPDWDALDIAEQAIFENCAIIVLGDNARCKALQPPCGVGPGVEPSLNASNFADRRRRPNDLRLNGPNDERPPASIRVHGSRKNTLPPDEQGDGAVERADREVNVVNPARVATEESLLVFEQIRAFAISMTHDATFSWSV